MRLLNLVKSDLRSSSNCDCTTINKVAVVLFVMKYCEIKEFFLLICY